MAGQSRRCEQNSHFQHINAEKVQPVCCHLKISSHASSRRSHAGRGRIEHWPIALCAMRMSFRGIVDG